MVTVVLLVISNVFMTFAWYGHLNFKSVPLWKVVGLSWLIAFFEYCFMVPANRLGSAQFTTPQLKVIQEVVTLSVFAVFSAFYLREPLRWNHAMAFLCMVGAVFFMFRK